MATGPMVQPSMAMASGPVDAAMQRIPSSILPIDGLRRDENGNLTPDALRMITDGLKSRGMDPTNPETKKKVMTELSTLLRGVNEQYQTLMNEITRKVNTQEPIEQSLLNAAKEKNLMMMDILNVSRHLEQIQVYDGSTQFIEGWQTGGSTGTGSTGSSVDDRLRREREMLESRSFERLRKQMVDITGEKNRVASNYLGLYGFLNIVAVGLLLYAAGMSKGQGQ